jgi:hypothetical protein
MWQLDVVDRLHVEIIHLVGCSNIDIIDNTCWVKNYSWAIDRIKIT